MTEEKGNSYASATKGRFGGNNHRHRFKEKSNNENSGFKGETEDIKDHTFIYGKGMADKCLVSKEKFIGYMGRKYGASERQSLEQGILTVVGAERPKSIKLKSEFENMFYSDQEEWKHEMKRFKDITAKTTTNLSCGYSILWEQCDQALKNKIKTHSDFEDAELDSDVIGLLEIISEICNSTTTISNFTMRMMEANYNLHYINGEGMDLSKYVTVFMERSKVAEQCGNDYGTKDAQLAIAAEAFSTYKDKTAKGYKDILKRAKAKAHERYLAFVFLKRAGYKYEELRIKLENDWSGGVNAYPETVNDAYTRLETFRDSKKLIRDASNSTRNDRSDTNNNSNSKSTTGLSFNQESGDGSDSSKKDVDWSKDKKCFKCERMGHITKFCKHSKKENGDPLNTNEQRQVHWDKLGESHYMDAEVVDADAFDFEDELNNDDCEKAYGFLHSTSTEQIEDLRGKNHIFNQKGKGRLNLFHILFDNQSTVNVFCNGAFLCNIRIAKKKLYLYTNAGMVVIDKVGDLPGVGTVWYHPDGIANVLSHARVLENGFEVDYSSRKNSKGYRDPAYRIETREGTKLRFIPNEKGLHFLDCTQYFGVGKTGCVFGKNVQSTETFDSSSKEQGIDLSNNGTEAIATIEGSKRNFNQRDVKRAEVTRRFQHVAGHLSDETIRHTARTNGIKNSPITVKDVDLMNDVLDVSPYRLKGKFIRRQPEAVETNMIPLPKSVEDHYMDVTLAIDVMHVNKIPFLVSVSRKIHYGTVHALASMKIPVMEEAIKCIIKSYETRGFTIKFILVDIQFRGIKDRNNLKGVLVSVVSRDEHVEDIERLIRMYKERVRCYWAMLPFKKIPRVMVVHLLETVKFYINAFVLKSGVSQHLSPMTIVEGVTLDYNKHFQVIFGEYAQVFEGTDNTMKERTVGAIALGPTGNLQGGVRFFSIHTGRILDRGKKDYQLLKMPQDVVRRVEQMARKSELGLSFGDRYNNNVTEDSDKDDASAIDSDDDESTGVITNNDIELEDNVNQQRTIDLPEDNIPSDLPDLQTPEFEYDSDDEEDDDEPPGLMEQDNDDDEDDNVNEDETITGVTTRSGRVSKSTKDNDYTYTQIDIDLCKEKIQTLSSESEVQNFINGLKVIEESAEYQDHIKDLIFTQFNIKQGLKKYPEEGKASVMKELNNMVNRDVFGEVEYESLTAEQRKWALPILLFMVMKRNGTLKSRACADGRTQRIWTNKEDVSSPTPCIEALKYTLIVDALEERDVATVDLPAQFLQTDMDEEIYLKINGPLALLLVESDKGRWEKHLRKEHGRPVIYVRCKKAIYGTLNAAILAYRKLTKYFEEWGFTMNPYEPCVWNKVINGKQFTIVFHVDDIKLSHVDALVVTMIIKKLQKEYGKLDGLTINRGKKHEYLGMNIDFSIRGEVRITMYDYVEKLIRQLPDDMIGSKKTTAAEYLFKTDSNGVLLSAKDKDKFHNLTAKTLWLSQRGRPDLQLATGFLCTRVREPNDHDWKKLGHEMKYLQHTKHLPLILRSDGKGTAIWIDGAHAVHHDMKGHVGLYASEGNGALMSASTKCKLNTISSTETEVVSVGEKLPKCVWFRHFRIEQGGNSTEDVLHQDNQSAMLLENNGIYSAGKGSKHVHVRYYFITDRIKRKEFKVMYCPTGEMIADFFTKPLQGAQFYKFRDAILGIKAEDEESYKQEYLKVLEQYGLLEKENDEKT